MMKIVYFERISRNWKSFYLNILPIRLVAIACFAYALFIAIKYASQVPLDLFLFRQTQTALTAFWFVKDGFKIAYETPVAGPPWSIPFEFPLYQYIVALASELSGISLNIVGRLVSFFFLALCLIPAQSIIKDLKLSGSVFYIFSALLFSSPLYLYWGRTFMIETAALFFAVAAIKYFINIIQGNESYKYNILYFIFINLSILQKSTTGLPVLAILCFVYFILTIQNSRMSGNYISTRNVAPIVILFALPLAIGVAWTLYTDHIKELNELGMNLTSASLNKWNWGTLSQRLSSAFYGNVIWVRIFQRNLLGALGIAILVGALFSNAKAQIKFTIGISLLMGLAPLFLFTNLHIVHDYYQTANLIFLIFAVAVSLGSALNISIGERKIFAIVIIILISNYINFSKIYLDTIKINYNKENSREYAISEILKREIPQKKSFIAFGNDWNSSFSYLSERKSFTVPEFFKRYKEISINPEKFIDERNLGAVVICSHAKSPTIGELIKWSSNMRSWKIGEVQGCYVATPEVLPASTKNISQIQCEGSIDIPDEIQIDNSQLLAVAGWSTISGERGIVPDKIFLTMKKNDSEPIFLETLKVNRPDINARFGLPNYADSGFSRIFSLKSLYGRYVIGLARLNNGSLESCQFQKEVFINSNGPNE